MFYVTSGLITYIHGADGSMTKIDRTITPQPEGDAVPQGEVIHSTPAPRVSETTKRKRYKRNVRQSKGQGTGLLHG